MRPSCTRSEEGFGLVDAMIAISLLLVIVMTTFFVMYDVVTQTGVARQRVAATELAEQWLETIANDPLTTLQGYIGHNVLLTPTPVTVVGTRFSVSAHLEWSGTGNSASLCLSGNPPQVISATVTVNWNVSVTLAETTVINPPYGTAVPTDGWVSVKITGGSGSAPPSDVTAVVVGIDDGPGGAVTDYSPDDNGCVYQQELPGTYTVALSGPVGGPSFIGGQENLTPSATATVLPGLTAFTSFRYDESSTLTFTASAGAAAATGMPVSVGNPELTPLPWRVAIPAGSAATSAALFPYPSGYDTWYGDCAAEEPGSPVNVAAPPNGNATAQITGLAELSLEVTNTAGAPVIGATSRATVEDSADSCPADTFGLSVATNASGTALSNTAVIPETYQVVVTDPGNGQTTTFSAQVAPASVTVGTTSYPVGTPVPVTVP